MTRKKIIIIISLITLVIVVYGVKHHGKTARFIPEAMVVEVEKVTQGSIPLEAHAVGTLVAAQNVEIAPETSGQVEKVLFEDGVFVKKGTPLIQLNNAVYQAKSDSAKANLNFSQTSQHRLALLARHGIISQQDMEKATADLKEKKAAAQENQVMLDRMLLTAPFDGVVGKCLVSPGNYVSAGQALVTLTDTHHLHVEYNVAENNLASLKLGQDLTITTSAYPGREFKGKVAYISPMINTQDRTISIYAEVPNDNQELSAGLFVNVTHSLGRQDNVLLVSATSLVATIDGQQVYKVVDGKAQTVPVVIGQRTQENVEILKGLALGDAVIISGQQKVRDGSEVKIKA